MCHFLPLFFFFLFLQSIFIKEMRGAAEDGEKIAFITRKNLTRPVYLTLALIGYALLFLMLGYLISTFLLMLAMSIIYDVRAPERYQGDVEPVDRVPGHIPGARNRPLATLLDEQGRLLPADRLQVLLRAHGPRAQRPQVMACGSGVTACLGILASRVAGLPDPLLYPGSYSDWSADTCPSRPATNRSAPYSGTPRSTGPDRQTLRRYASGVAGPDGVKESLPMHGEPVRIDDKRAGPAPRRCMPCYRRRSWDSASDF